MAVVVVTPPAREPLDLLTAKKHLRLDLDNDDQDELVALLIQTAREMAEHELGRALITQTLKLRLSLLLAPPPALSTQYQPLPVTLYQQPGQVPVAEIPLLRVAADTLQAVISINLIALDGTVTALDPSQYVVNTTQLRPRLLLKHLVSVQDAVVVYQAGYGNTPADVPAGIRRWLLFYVNTLFENREAVVVGQVVYPIPNEFIDGLLDPYRIPVSV
jgi:hypothetical protein